MASARRCSGTRAKRPGFTTGDPWLPVPPSAKTINVAVQKNDPHSLLTWYRSPIRLKKTVPAMEYGANIMLDTENIKVLRLDAAGARRRPGW